MLELTPHQISTLTRFNTSLRFTGQGPTIKKTGEIEEIIKDGGYTCHAIDIATGKEYLKIAAPTEGQAAELVIAAIPEAEKPLTPAQEETMRAVGSALREKDVELASKDAEIADLKKQIEDAKTAAASASADKAEKSKPSKPSAST